MEMTSFIRSCIFRNNANGVLVPLLSAHTSNLGKLKCIGTVTTLGLGFQPSVQCTVFISHLQGSDQDTERKLRYRRVL